MIPLVFIVNLASRFVILLKALAFLSEVWLANDKRNTNFKEQKPLYLFSF